MIQINAIRYKIHGESEAVTWRFNDPQHRRILVFQGPDQAAKHLVNALQMIVEQKSQPLIAEAAMHFTDELGDVWIVEQKDSRRRILKNNQALANPQIAEALVETALDLRDEAIRWSRLDFTGTQLKLVDERNDHLELQKLEIVMQKQIEAVREKVSRIFDQPLMAEINRESRAKLESLYLSFREVSIQRRQLSESAEIDETLIPRLERDIEILRHIESMTTPLIDPSQSPKLLKEKAAKLEAELKQILPDTPDLVLPLLDIPWEKLVSCLIKVEAYERLVQQSEKSQSLQSEHIQGIFNEYVKVIENILINDSQITCELENCLSTISQQSLRQRPKPKESFSELVLKFMKPTADVPVNESHEGPSLETIRMAIDFALTRLGELHANLKESRQNVEQMNAKNGEHHERLVHEYGKIKALWMKLSREHQIPSHIKLSELLKLSVRQVRINELAQLQEQLKSAITTRKTQLIKLEQTLELWRQQSKSQKESVPTNPSIILSEAQNAVRYLPARQQQLDKLREAQRSQQAQRQIRLQVEQRESLLRNTWKKHFDDILVPEVAIERAGWSEFFQLSQQMDAWMALKQQAGSIASNTQPLAELNASFNLVTMMNDFKSNQARLTLVNSLSQIQSTSAIIVLATNDAELAALLQRENLGGIRKLVPKTQQSVPPKSHNKVDQVMSLLRGGTAT